MNKLILFTLTLFSLSAFSAQYTAESLFRHSSNADITQNDVVLNFIVRNLNEENSPIFYLKIITEKKDGKTLYHQIVYDGAEMNAHQIMDSVHLIEESPHKQTVESELFNLTISSLIFNDARPILTFLKSNGVPLKTNSESYNKEKIKLLEQYKNYLKSSKMTAEQNPLSPANFEEKKRVQHLMKESLFSPGTENTHLVLKNKNLYLKLDYPNFYSLFSNEDHLLFELELNHKGYLAINFEEYLKLDGIHLFPKYITVKTFDNTYRIQTMSVKYFSETEAEFNKRTESFAALVKKNNKGQNFTRPKFLY